MYALLYRMRLGNRILHRLVHRRPRKTRTWPKGDLLIRPEGRRGAEPEAIA